MPIRVYVHAPAMPNTLRSLDYLRPRLAAAGLLDRASECVSDPTLFEYPTLHKLWRDAQSEDFYALYLHAKGASKTKEREYLNAEAWMDFMLYGVVDNWRTCVVHMDRGAHLVGSQWYRHFKGNFWWGKSTYLRCMPDPMRYLPKRTAAKYRCSRAFWGSEVPKPAVKNLFYVEGLGSDSTYSAARACLSPASGQAPCFHRLPPERSAFIGDL